MYDYNEQGLLINLAALSSQLMWPEHPLGRSVAGVPATVNGLDAEHLRAHHARHYHPANMVLGMVGNVAPEEGFALARRHYGNWQPEGGAPSGAGERPAFTKPGGREGGPHLKLVPNPDNQFHFQLGFPAPGYNDREELAVILLARTLDDGPTSRLQRVLREEQALVYHVQAEYSSYWDTGAFEVSTSVTPDRLEPLLRCLLGELADYREHGPSADEVARARLRHLFELEFDRDSLSARMERYVWPHLHATVREEEDERAQLERVTPAHLQELAGRMFRRARAHLVLVGPLEADSEARVRGALEAF
jgi:predicted Zn-dependent peptidase